MTRKASGASKELQRSMNQQVRMTTVEEYIRNEEAIDQNDDKRRDKLLKTIKWINESNTYFSKKFANKEYCDYIHMVKMKLRDLVEEELYYEKLDDSRREALKEYLAASTEELKEENMNCEMRIMEENRQRKKHN